MVLTKKEKKKGKEILAMLYNTHPILIRSKIDKMDVEKAKRWWRLLEPRRPFVASMASRRKRDMKHLTVLKMMQLIQKKAEGGNVDER